MSNFKLNKSDKTMEMGMNSSDFNIGDVPSVDEARVSQDLKQNEAKNESYIKEQKVEEQRKLFKNKKANIALGIVAAIVIIAWVGIQLYISNM